jgi:hypothetical protein
MVSTGDTAFVLIQDHSFMREHFCLLARLPSSVPLALLMVIAAPGCGGDDPAPAGSAAGGGASIAAAGRLAGGTTGVAGANAADASHVAGRRGESGAAATAGSAARAGTSAIAGAGAPAASGGAGASSGAAGTSPAGTRFSFFMTSQAGLIRLANNANGFGGNLKFGKADGLSGADEICRQLADSSMPGNGKTWRAFLSATQGPQGSPVNAIDRVGAGPWYDRRERLLAMDKSALLNMRPLGADPLIINDLPNEDGVPNHDPGSGIVDNHNVLTGSTTTGTIDEEGLDATCQDWTSSDKAGGSPRCGVSWPRGKLVHWISVLNEGGCVPGATEPGKDSGTSGTVGALGGYGGFYCFALTP